MAYPKFRKVFHDLKTNLENQKGPYYEDATLFSKIKLLPPPSLDLHNTIRILKWGANFFKTFRRHEQV